MTDDSIYNTLPMINITLSPYFYRQLNKNNKVYEYEDTEHQYSVRLLKGNPPVRFLDELGREVYGKDSEGNVIADLSNVDELNKVSKGDDGEYILYYKETIFTLNDAKTGYTITYKEHSDEYKTFSKVLDCSKILQEGYSPVTITNKNSSSITDSNTDRTGIEIEGSPITITDSNTDRTGIEIEGSPITITDSNTVRKGIKNEGILKEDISEYVYDEFKDKDNNKFTLNGIFSMITDSNINLKMKQSSKDMKLVGEDGDEDAHMDIGGIIVYDPDNNFMLCYALFDTSQNVSGSMNIENYDYREWLNIDYTCRISDGGETVD